MTLRKECNINLACRSKSFPPQILQAPPRILPKLSEVEEEEALVRFRYWVSLLVLLGCAIRDVESSNWLKDV